MAKRAQQRIGVLQGTLDMLILRTLRYGPAHGHQIGKHIQRTTNEFLQMQHGSLYPALPAVIVNQTFVRQFLNGSDPVGQLVVSRAEPNYPVPIPFRNEPRNLAFGLPSARNGQDWYVLS
jgi:hypothetical protein